MKTFVCIVSLFCLCPFLISVSPSSSISSYDSEDTLELSFFQVVGLFIVFLALLGLVLLFGVFFLMDSGVSHKEEPKEGRSHVEYILIVIALLFTGFFWEEISSAFWAVCLEVLKNPK